MTIKIDSIEASNEASKESNTNNNANNNASSGIDLKALAKELASIMGNNNTVAEAKVEPVENKASGRMFNETENDYAIRLANEMVEKRKSAEELKALCEKWVDPEDLANTEEYFKTTEDRDKILKALALENMLLKYDEKSILKKSNSSKPYSLLVGSAEKKAEEFLKLGHGLDRKAKTEMRANFIADFWDLKEQIENAVAVQEKAFASNHAYANAFKSNSETPRTRFIKRSAERFGLKG